MSKKAVTKKAKKSKAAGKSKNSKAQAGAKKSRSQFKPVESLDRTLLGYAMDSLEGFRTKLFKQTGKVDVNGDIPWQLGRKVLAKARRIRQSLQIEDIVRATGSKLQTKVLSRPKTRTKSPSQKISRLRVHKAKPGQKKNAR